MNLLRRNTSRRIAGGIAGAAIAGASLLGAQPALASTTPADSGWTLDTLTESSPCFPSNGPTVGSYYLVIVTGNWSTTIRYGLTDLPGGVSGSSGTLAPGSNEPAPDGTLTVNGLVSFEGPTPPAGVYHPVIYATDGAQTQSYPVTLDVETNCSS